MEILIGAILTASLLGSLHCVGMCGPLALWAAGVDKDRGGRTMVIPTALYHFGRMLTYALVGLMAGYVGNLLDWSGSAFGLQLIAARLFGSLMIVMGCILGFRLAQPVIRRWVRQYRKSSRLTVEPAVSFGAGQWEAQSGGAALNSYTPPKPNWLTARLLSLRPVVFRLPLAMRGLVTGLLTALLPCGWLYLFALLAAGSGSAVIGAFVMVAFWLGSVPALVSLVVSTKLLTTPVRRAIPAFGATMLVVAGAYTATGRGFTEFGGKINVSSSLLDRLQTGQSVGELTADQIKSGLEELTSTPLPCCQRDLSAESLAEREERIGNVKSE
jgi:sulfite exporter TauE/SafE